MEYPTLFVFSFLVGIYIVEPEMFRNLPEMVDLARKIISLEARRFFLKRKLKRQIDRDFRKMKKDMERFTKDRKSVK